MVAYAKDGGLPVDTGAVTGLIGKKKDKDGGDGNGDGDGDGDGDSKPKKKKGGLPVDISSII